MCHGGFCFGTQLLLTARALCVLEHMCDYRCRWEIPADGKYQRMGNAACLMVASYFGEVSVSCWSKLQQFVAWNTFVDGGADTSRWGMQCVPWWLLPWGGA